MIGIGSRVSGRGVDDNTKPILVVGGIVTAIEDDGNVASVIYLRCLTPDEFWPGALFQRGDQRFAVDTCWARVDDLKEYVP